MTTSAANTLKQAESDTFFRKAIEEWAAAGYPASGQRPR
jgi:hypothetical protein